MHPWQWRLPSRLPYWKSVSSQSYVLQLWQMYQLMIKLFIFISIFLSFFTWILIQITLSPGFNFHNENYMSSFGKIVAKRNFFGKINLSTGFLRDSIDRKLFWLYFSAFVTYHNFFNLISKMKPTRKKGKFQL